MSLDAQTGITAVNQYVTGTDSVTMGTQLFNDVGGADIIQNATGVVVTPENVSLITQILRIIFGGA